MNELLPSPHITALNDKEQIQQMRSYLFQLKESLEFILTNIGKENLSAPMLKELQKIGVSIEEVQNDVDMRQKTTVGLINESNLTVSDVIESALFEAEKAELKEYADTVAGEAAQNPGEHEHTVGDITDFPSSITPTAHSHTKSEISDFPSEMTPTAHTHKKAEVTDFAHTHTKSEITDFPTSIPPSAHTHSEYVTKRDSGSSYNNLAHIYVGGAFTSGSYYRIELPDNVVSVWAMLYMEVSVRQNYTSGLSGKILINAYHSNTDTKWTAFNASTIGNLDTNIKVYGSDGKYFYIGGCGPYTNVSVDKILVGDAAIYQDISGVSISAVTSLPTTYQTAIMTKGNTVIVDSDPGEGASVSYPSGTIIFVRG